MATTSVPQHIATWAKDFYWGAGANGSSAQVRQYLTYAQGGLGDAKASNDCTGSNGCSSIFYFDPNFFYDESACGSAESTQILKNANESWYVHLTGYSDSAHRAQGSYTMTCGGKTVTIPVYAMNSLSTSMQSYYTSYFHTNAAAFNYFMMDDTSAKVLSQFYGPGGGFCWNVSPNHWCSATQEMPTDASVVAEHVALGKALTHPNGTPMQGFFNGINFSGTTVNGLSILSSAGSPYVGAWCEDCVVNSGTFRPTMYANVLNAMAQIDKIPNSRFVELNHGESAIGSAAQIAQREITTAIAWLGYSEGHTVVYPDLEANTNNLAVFPENSIYPTGPLQTMNAGATDIQVAPGVYRREFSACYNAGVAIGPCASIVNANSSTVVVKSAWLSQTYGHLVVMSGGDIPAGGKVNLTSTPFVANSTTLGGAQGMLIVR
ncbi:MAG: hypothetical protein JO322_01805 [Candidatus Eremiobacteraeota bacterium]|nr:hypothetical protein [Candidatus Eremiobacteraeota bacterium]